MCTLGACRTHFMTITSTTEAAAVRSRRDGVLWLWKAHNEVNARLQQVGLCALCSSAMVLLVWTARQVSCCDHCQWPVSHTEDSVGGLLLLRIWLALAVGVVTLATTGNHRYNQATLAAERKEAAHPSTYRLCLCVVAQLLPECTGENQICLRCDVPCVPPGGEQVWAQQYRRPCFSQSAVAYRC
jgi:hypothetical protein